MIRKLFNKIRYFGRRKRIEKKVRDSVSLLRRFDHILHMKGFSRNQRRHFWREFAKTEETREKVIKGLLNLLNVKDEENFELYELEKEKDNGKS